LDVRALLDRLIDWPLFGFGVPILIGVGFTVLADEFKAFRAARVCFYLAAIWIGGKATMWAIFTSDRVSMRMLVVFLVFGTVRVIFVETLRLTTSREVASRESKIPSLETIITKPPAEPTPLVRKPLSHQDSKKTRMTKEQQAFLLKLTQLYISSHDGISSEMIAGLELPPESWLNEKLRQYHKNWRISNGTMVGVSATSTAPAITQQGQNNIAQIGDNNQATINTDLPTRILNAQQALAFSKNVASSIPPQPFFLITETNDRDPESERMILSNQLGQILKAAKWTHLVEEINTGRLKRILPVPYMMTVTGERGITIAAPERLMPYALALGKEMDRFSLRHNFRRFDMMGGNNDIPVDFIAIIVRSQ
jgi:hypothetical protein